MKAAFTLLELLITVSIVIIMASISFSVSSKIINKAKEMVCMQQVGLIDLAIKSYKLEYGHVPTHPKIKEQPIYTDKKEGKELILCLMGETDQIFKNNRSIQFFSPKASDDNTDGWNEKSGLFDPWGNPYVIIIDTDGDYTIDVSMILSHNKSWHRSEKSKGKNKLEPELIKSDTAIAAVKEDEDKLIKSW